MRKFDVQVLLDLVDRFSGPLKSGPMKQLTALQKQTEITDRSMNRLLTGGGVVAAGLALAAPLIFSFNAASDLTEALNKNQVVFGQHARQVQRWAATSSTAFGQARVDALGTVGTFGNLFTSMGLTQGRAAGLSMDIVQLGSDLASFNNTSPTDALDALRSGLVGEIEPLRRYGVNLSAAAVARKAFAMGLTPKVMNATDINPATQGAGDLSDHPRADRKRARRLCPYCRRFSQRPAHDFGTLKRPPHDRGHAARAGIPAPYPGVS